MRLIPAIDLKGGKCVRLYKGDFDQVTEYNDDPAAVAREYQALADRVHHGTNHVIDFHSVGLTVIYISLVLSIFSAIQYFQFFLEAAEDRERREAEAHEDPEHCESDGPPPTSPRRRTMPYACSMVLVLPITSMA